MNDEQVRFHFQVIRQHFAALQREKGETWEAIEAALEDLHVIYEQMQTSLEVAELVEEELLQQTQQLSERYYYYYNLFYSSPTACLVTDTHALILEANQEIAQLLNVSQRHLAGTPLILYVEKRDRPYFYFNLNQLFQSSGTQVWPINLCPREGKPFAAELHVDIIPSASGLFEKLQIGVHAINQSPQWVTPLRQRQNRAETPVEEMMPVPRLPQSLDGLRVLVVDDEADAREFVTAVLEAYGIQVKAVPSVAAALAALEPFQPDVLVSDIRMPGADGYSLIRQIRALEAEQGVHLPAAAVTAYLDEDREKALTAGFEAHLHKLAQPSEWVEMVARLAGCGGSEG